MDNKLYRSVENKVIGGVCGGLGEYFEIDPTLVRVIAVVLFLATQGFAILAYIVGLIIIPKKPPIGVATEEPSRPSHSSWNKYLPGIILIFLGSILLIREHWFWLDLSEWWPALLIVGGLMLIFHKRRTPVEDIEQDGQSTEESDLKNGGTVS